jgi:hypothetical protein
MFGKKKSMVEGQARILQDEGPAGYGGMVGDPTANMKYIVEVQPASGEPFRVETKAKVELISPPVVGDVLRALYDPESHKVELQLEGDPRYDSKVRKAAQKARREELLHGGPPTHESVVQDEMETLNRLAQQAIEELQEAENRGAPQAELDELMQKVNDAIEKQEDLLTRMENRTT